MKFERYLLELTGQGVVIRLRQAANAVGVCLIAAIALLAVWWYGPYGGKPTMPLIFYWSVTALLGFILVASILGMFYSEEFRIAPGLVQYRNTFGKSRTIKYRETITARIKVASATARHDGRVFPYQVVLLEGGGRSESGLKFIFQSRDITKRFVKRLAEKVPFHVVDTVEEDFFHEKRLKGWDEKQNKLH